MEPSLRRSEHSPVLKASRIAYSVDRGGGVVLFAYRLPPLTEIVETLTWNPIQLYAQMDRIRSQTRFVVVAQIALIVVRMDTASLTLPIALQSAALATWNNPSTRLVPAPPTMSALLQSDLVLPCRATVIWSCASATLHRVLIHSMNVKARLMPLVSLQSVQTAAMDGRDIVYHHRTVTKEQNCVCLWHRHLLVNPPLVQP